MDSSMEELPNQEFLALEGKLTQVDNEDLEGMAQIILEGAHLSDAYHIALVRAVRLKAGDENYDKVTKIVDSREIFSGPHSEL